MIKGDEEKERVFQECHLNAGGHKGRDATIGKVKERYYWPNYYKEVFLVLAACNSCVEGMAPG